MNRLGHSIRNLLCFYIVFLPYVLLGDLNNGLVAWYPFDGNASDMSGNGNHGAVNGATLGTDRHGQANKAYSFDGVDDKISLPTLWDVGSGGASISLWFKVNGTITNWMYLTSNKSNFNNNFLRTGFDQSGRMRFYTEQDGGTNSKIISDNDYDISEWIKVVFIRQGSVGQIIVNGSIEETKIGVTQGGDLGQVHEAWHIGFDGVGSAFFNGLIDDIRIYDRALSASEVFALYNLEKPKIPLTDSNFQAAVNLWFSDEANATATYGHISDWNTSSVTDMDGAFNDRSAFNENISTWDLSNVTNTRHMFKGATSFNQDIGNWNTSKVTTMHGMFQDASSFNQSIEDWNTSEVKWMGYMFSGATSFNQPLGNWNVSSIVTMVGMFDEAESFNQAIGDWNTSTVTDMRWMFLRASSFNQPIGSWDLSNVVQLNDMFKGATAFNQPIGDWNVSSVTGMSRMFYNASSFNQNLGNWDVSSVTNMEEMFRGAAFFNQNLSNWNLSTSPDLNMTDMFLITPALSNFNKGNIHEAFSTNQNWTYDWREFVVIDDSNFQTAVNLWFDNQAEANSTYGHISDWNTSAVTEMSDAFKNRTTFNEDISAWDVSNVKNMVRLFSSANSFNQDIGNWDTAKVLSMQWMFLGADDFNQDIGNWNTSNVTTMFGMFDSAISFNQDIGDWNVSSVTNMHAIFEQTTAFNQDLSNWDTQSLKIFSRMFNDAIAFNQDLSDWNISEATTMGSMFNNTTSLSDANKAAIHYSFKSNPNWTTDWSSYVGSTPLNDSNFQTAVNLWFSDEANATATYGHISDWNTSAVTNMANAFKDRTNFNEDIGGWDVSNVTNMNHMFRSATLFNQDIGDWGTSNVTHTEAMFMGASAFNQPIGEWDVSSVANMKWMFREARAFNQDIGDWDTSNVINMNNMFYSAHSFNQPIGSWDVSKVSNMKSMFTGAKVFNQNLSDWNITAVSDMGNMFQYAFGMSDANKAAIHYAFKNNPNWTTDWSSYVGSTPLNDSNFQTAVDLWFSNEANAIATFGHISDWNTSAVTNMGEAFRDRTDFNGDISDWDVSSVTNMWSMFRNARVFNQDIGDWDTSNVTNMGFMFADARLFNHPIGAWDVSSVTKIEHMFRQAPMFNQQIGDWNTSNVVNMSEMFWKAHAFNQNISGWDVSSVIVMRDMFKQAYAFSDANKGLIHESFSSNSNWPYDWRPFVLIDDSNFHRALDLWFDNQAEANATYGHISDWNTSAVTDMSEAFKGRTEFNEDISGWDVSNVTKMKMMFRIASAFNQPIGDWNTSSVKNMQSMFFGASSFNQPIGNWNTSNVVNMSEMFWKAFVFDQPINDWNTSSVMEMNLIFRSAIAFNQDISNWNVSSVNDFEDAFFDSDSMSKNNKGLIHEAFSFNPNWPYDWSEFVSDSNSLPTDDHNQTQPSQPDSIVLAPMVATYGHQRDENNMITLHGKIRSGGNGTIEQLGFYVRTSLDGNDTVLLADNLSVDDSFSITFSSKDSFYFQALARNEKGETKGTWKRVGATMQSYPFDGVVETGDGWSTSEWFGDFRYFENGWAYHYGLGWIYLSADREDGMWLWRKEHGWLWSNQEAWPFLWSHASGDWIYLLIRAKQDPLFFDYSTGRYGR